MVLNEKDDDESTISGAALNFMWTLGKHYKPNDFAEQLIPCCSFMVAQKDGDLVVMRGCKSGFDWTIKEDNLVRHMADTGEQAIVGSEYYKKIVLSFAGSVKQFYQDSVPKVLDDYDRADYEAFWKEWEILRNEFF